MKAVISLEMVADDFYYHQRHESRSFDWQLRYMRKLGPDKAPSSVMRLRSTDGRIVREFVRGTRDYTDANSTGSRGIHTYYVLDDGIYEVHDRYALNRVHRYHVRVDGETITTITEREATEWLKSNSSVSAS